MSNALFIVLKKQQSPICLFRIVWRYCHEYDASLYVLKMSGSSSAGVRHILHPLSVKQREQLMMRASAIHAETEKHATSERDTVNVFALEVLCVAFINTDMR